MTDIESSPCIACASDDGQPTCTSGTCGERRGFAIELADPCGVCKGGGKEKCPFLRLQKPCLAKLAHDRLVARLEAAEKSACIDAKALHEVSETLAAANRILVRVEGVAEKIGTKPLTTEELITASRLRAAEQLEEGSR